MGDLGGFFRPTENQQGSVTQRSANQGLQDQADNLLGQALNQSTIAPINQTITGGLQAQREGANPFIQAQQGTNQALATLGQQQASGAFLDPASNPFISQVADEATANIKRDALGLGSQLQSAAVQAGAFGNSRLDANQRRLISDATQNIADTRARIFQTNFENERQRQMQTPAFIQQAVAAGQAPGSALTQTGILQQQLESQQMAELANRARMLLGANPFASSGQTRESATFGPSPFETSLRLAGAAAGFF